MSYYFKYSFVSPENVYSIVQEEFKSYFDSGAVDNLLFPTYLDKCLQKLGRSSYVISEEALYIEDFQARLPDNFYAVREAWACEEHSLRSYQEPSSFYSQTKTNVIQISPLTYGGIPCNNPACVDANCSGSCLPEVLQAVYKTNHEFPRVYRKDHLLKPGNISVHKQCSLTYTECLNLESAYSGPRYNFIPNAATVDSFDIRDNKFVTTFRNGIVHLVFYATEYDKTGNQLMPDNLRIREYVEQYIKYKVIETLTNQTNDETFNQLQQKLVYYKQLADEAFIMASIEIKKSTVYHKQRKIKEDLNRLSMYELSNGPHRYGRRNN
jgi:hypothetical protein